MPAYWLALFKMVIPLRQQGRENLPQPYVEPYAAYRYKFFIFARIYAQ